MVKRMSRPNCKQATEGPIGKDAWKNPHPSIHCEDQGDGRNCQEAPTKKARIWAWRECNAQSPKDQGKPPETQQPSYCPAQAALNLRHYSSNCHKAYCAIEQPITSAPVKAASRPNLVAASIPRLNTFAILPIAALAPAEACCGRARGSPPMSGRMKEKISVVLLPIPNHGIGDRVG
jgi:hypothetical protein